MNTDRTTNNSAGIGPHLSDETLSDLASGHLNAAAREAARRHLAACPECAGIARDNAVIRSLLRQLPAPRPSRSFQLTEAQADAAAKRRSWPNLASSLPALRAATIAVALLLLAVAGTDWLTRPSDNNAATEHFAAMVAPTEAVTTEVTSGGAAVPTEVPSAKSANRAPTETTVSNPAVAAAPNETTANESEAPGSAADSSAADMAGAAAPASAAKISPNLEASPTAPPTATAAPSPTPSPTAIPTAAPSPTATPAAVAASASKPDRTGWRVAELALGLLLLWLIVTYAGAWQTSRNRG